LGVGEPDNDNKEDDHKKHRWQQDGKSNLQSFKFKFNLKSLIHYFSIHQFLLLLLPVVSFHFRGIPALTSPCNCQLTKTEITKQMPNARNKEEKIKIAKFSKI